MDRLPQLDGLRGLAILMVFAAHAFRVPGLWVGVDLFFVLSGFLITRVLLRLTANRESGYWVRFYTRRAKRILPPYLLFLGLTLLFMAPHWRNSWLYYLCFASNFPLALGTVPVAALTPLWSLAVEEQFYFAWPWIVRFCSNRAIRNTATAVLLSAPMLRALATPHFHSHLPIYAMTPFRADTLACGALIALCENEVPGWAASKRRAGWWVMISAGFALVAMSAAFPSFHTGANSVLFNTVGYSLNVALFGGLLVYSLSGSGALQKILSFVLLRYVGRISYTFYLYHVAVLLVLQGRIHNLVLLATGSFVITTAISALSWRFIESRILERAPEGDIRRSPDSHLTEQTAPTLRIHPA